MRSPIHPRTVAIYFPKTRRHLCSSDDTLSKNHSPTNATDIGKTLNNPIFISNSNNHNESPHISSNNNPQNEDFDAECIPDEEIIFRYSPCEEDESPGIEENYRRSSRESIRAQADQVFKILQQDGPGFNSKTALDELQLKTVSVALVREVFIRILMSINGSNKDRCARLAYKFFSWSSQVEGYRHTSSTFNLTLKVLAETEEFRAMWRLVDRMTEEGIPVTARTFNIVISTCWEAGLGRKLVERFIQSKNFNYRPFKHSFNAILLSLLIVNQYRLVEWVHQKMLLEGYEPDVLTYNVLMHAKFKLGKMDEFYQLFDEMGKKGLRPDIHTYSLLLHMLGKLDKPLVALNILNYMNEVGCSPSVLHFTALIDGLSRAGNLDACQYFYDEMVKKGCEPDVVCFTVMITSYVIAGEVEKAQNIFDDMFLRGQLPNTFTYNAMIRGFCIVGKFDEACSMLKSMEARGCTPNFAVFSTLISRLRTAGKVSEADDIISYMVEKNHYPHLVSRFMGYNRSKYR